MQDEQDRSFKKKIAINPSSNMYFNFSMSAGNRNLVYIPHD
jgi:hypothetical protein